MAGKSWGHAIRRMTPEELVAYGGTGSKCAGKCPNQAGFENSYRYVTGQAGRATTARRPACDEHARRFAAKHDLIVPRDAEAGQPSTSQAMINAALGVDPGEGPRAVHIFALFADVAARYADLELPGRMAAYSLACRACEMPMAADTGHIGSPCDTPLPAPIYGWSASNRPLFRWQPRDERAVRPADATFWWETIDIPAGSAS